MTSILERLQGRLVPLSLLCGAALFLALYIRRLKLHSLGRVALFGSTSTLHSNFRNIQSTLCTLKTALENK